MPEPANFVVVDDTDPRINYVGPWMLEAAGEKDGEEWTRLFGPTWNATLHRAQQAASFSFPFNGTYLIVFGSYQFDDTKPLPSWKCAIDDVAIPSKELVRGFRNLARFCDAEVAGGKEHMLTVNVTFPNGGELLLDQIHFTPEVEPTEGEFLKYQESDPHLLYDPASNWKAGPGASRMTNVTGSTVSIEFTGVGFRAWGPVSSNVSNTATYTIDDKEPVSFALKTWDVDPGGGVAYHQEILSVSNLEPTHHKIVTTFTGNEQGVPLAVDFVHVQLPPASTTAPSASTSAMPSSSGVSVGAIVGGVMGGLMGLSILLLGLFLFRRRKHRNNVEDADSNYQPPPVLPAPPRSSVTAFTSPMSTSDTTSYRGSVPTTATRKGQTTTTTTTWSTPSGNQTSRPEPEIRHHLDSGIRLNHPPSVVDVPPRYTED